MGSFSIAKPTEYLHFLKMVKGFNLSMGECESGRDKIPILKEGNLQISFDERVVRQVCGMMRCGKIAEECIGRMINRTMECTLCYIALRMLKIPFQVEGRGICDVQLN